MFRKLPHHTVIAGALAVALAAPIALAPAAAAPTPAHAARTTTELPRGVRPLHYDIALTPDAANSRFSASTTITLAVTTPTRSLTLNAADLDFSQAVLRAANGSRQVAAIRVDKQAQTASFRFARPLQPGRYTLALDYTGMIGTQAAGLFALDYDTPGGKRRALYTQFENSDARRVIPSWDEPAYKASFTLRATVDAALLAVSNMPVAARSTLPDGRVTVRFATSPRMSTYLLFFALGDFERSTAQVDGTELGLVTRRGTLPEVQFALTSSQDLLREYNRYFGISYPLPKLDNVAGPGRSQFFSAMENWGAIFTFEHALLLDPSLSTQRDKQEVFATAAHEMAHQWFGNLVTMRWWDELWLNEGFASWMEARMTARLHPEWNTLPATVNNRDLAMRRDALPTTHPVVQHVASAEEASLAFDEITYQKGEAVLRMLEAYVGEDAWRRGVSAYLRANAYGNTASSDLWRQIEGAARVPVSAIARDFTLQPGVPLVRVAAPVCQDGRMRVALRQGEFSRVPARARTQAWRVPVIAASADGKAQARTLLAGGKGSLTLPGCGAVVVNAGQSGYYRSLYAPAAFAQLTAQFAHLAPIDQIGLLADAWALGQAGLQPASDFLALVEATPAHADAQVWARIADTFDELHALYGSDLPGRARLAAHASARLAPQLAQLGWQARPGEAGADANLRERLITVLGRLGHGPTIAEARRRYAAMERDPQAVPGALRSPILGVVAEHADRSTWEALARAAREQGSPMMKDLLFLQLAGTGDPALAAQALELAISDGPEATLGAEMIAGVARLHPELAFDFVLAHADAVNERLDAASRSRFVPMLAASGASPALAARVAAYAQAHIARPARRDADTAVASIRERASVREKRLPVIDAWLLRQGH